MRFASIVCLPLSFAYAEARAPDTAYVPSGVVEAVQTVGMPTREDFFREVLEPAALPTSASFHDGAPDTYYVDKIVFWQEFPSFARNAGHELKGLVVFGPTGVLWTYHIFAFLDEGDSIRVNQVVFPHARLTLKQTALLSQDEAERWLVKLASLPEVREIEPDPKSLASQLPPNDLGDFRFDLLVLYPIQPTRAFISGELAERPPAERPELYAHLNALVSKLKSTYQHGDSVPARQSQSPAAQQGAADGQSQAVMPFAFAKATPACLCR